MSKGSAPAAPDPVTTAAAQTASNQATATTQSELNNINQVTPYGSLSYNQTGSYGDGTPQYTQTESLSPAEQSLLNTTQQGETTLGQTALGSLGNVQNTYSSPFSFGGPAVTGTTGNSGNIQTNLDTSGVPAIQSTITNGANDPQAISDAENAVYNQQTQYLNPQFAQQQQSLNAQLANEGLSVADAGYNNGQQTFGNQENQAYQGAMDEAVTAGQSEQNTLYGQGLSSANLANSANAQAYGEALDSGNFANSAQAQQYGQNLSNAGLQNSASAQALQQQLALYNQPLNQYNALMTGAQVQAPSFSATNPATMAGTNTAGITQNSYTDALQGYQAQQASINNLFGLGGNLGAAAILA